MQKPAWGGFSRTHTKEATHLLSPQRVHTPCMAQRWSPPRATRHRSAHTHAGAGRPPHAQPAEQHLSHYPWLIVFVFMTIKVVYPRGRKIGIIEQGKENRSERKRHCYYRKTVTSCTEKSESTGKYESQEEFHRAARHELNLRVQPRSHVAQ